MELLGVGAVDGGALGGDAVVQHFGAGAVPDGAGAADHLKLDRQAHEPGMRDALHRKAPHLGRLLRADQQHVEAGQPGKRVPYGLAGHAKAFGALAFGEFGARQQLERRDLLLEPVEHDVRRRPPFEDFGDFKHMSQSLWCCRAGVSHSGPFRAPLYGKIASDATISRRRFLHLTN